MSLDLTLYRGDEQVAEINWLRNPFGLCNWAEDNVAREGEPEESTLYYVCNHWAYDKAGEPDRPHFRNVVREYERRIADLTQGRFFFNLSAYRQFVQPHYDRFPLEDSWSDLPRIKGEKYIDNRLAIPQEYFSDRCFNIGDSSLAEYKRWFGRLVAFADELQDETLRLYCSN